jgi:hypothetical protein
VTNEPQLRANWTKLALHVVRELPAHERDAVLAAAGDLLIARIRGAGLFEWLPVTLHLGLANALREVLGARAGRFWTDLQVASYERSLLKPLIDGGLRLFGHTPRSMLRLTPQAFSLVARRCGTITVSGGEIVGAARLVFDDVPRELRTPAWVEIIVANCQAVLDYLKMRGEVSVDASGLDAGRFETVTTPRP